MGAHVIRPRIGSPLRALRALRGNTVRRSFTPRSLPSLAAWYAADNMGTPNLTLSDGVITDAMRAAGVQGDGRAPETSMGVYPAVTNLCTTQPGAGGNWTNTGVGFFLVPGVATLTPAAGLFPGAARMQVANTQYGGVAYTLTVTPATQYTISFWVSGTVSAGTILSHFGEADGGSYQSRSFTPTETPTRQSITWTSGADTAAVLAIRTGTTATADITISGVQIEPGPIATPFTPSSRTAGRIQCPAGMLSATQSWAAFRLRVNWGTSLEPYGGVGVPYIFEWRVDANNRLTCFYSEASNVFAMSVYESGSGDIATQAKSLSR